MAEANSAQPSYGKALLGRRTLRTVDAAAEALALGPIVTVGFLAFLIAGAGGSATPLVALISFAGFFAFGWTISLYARRYAGAGAVYEYIARGQSRAFGVLAAGIFFLPKLIMLIPALVTGLLFEAFCIEHLGFDPGWWTGGVVSAVLVFAVTYRGVKVSTRGLLALTILSAIPLAALSVVIIAKGGDSGNTLSVFDPEGPAVPDLFRALLFGTALFVGFEAAACLGEEVRLPTRSIPKAMLLTIAIAGAFYLLVLYSATIGFGPDKVAAEWGASPTAYDGLGNRYIGAPVGALIALGILLDNVAVQIAASNYFARGYYALARDALLPSAIGTESRHGTPTGGLIAYAVANIGVVLAAAFFADRFELVTILGIASLLTTLPIYIVLGLGPWRLLGRGGALIWKVPVVLFGAAVPVLGIYGTLDPFPMGSAEWGVWLALVSLAAVALWFGFLWFRRRGRVRAAASYAVADF